MQVSPSAPFPAGVVEPVYTRSSNLRASPWRARANRAARTFMDRKHRQRCTRLLIGGTRRTSGAVHHLSGSLAEQQRQRFHKPPRSVRPRQEPPFSSHGEAASRSVRGGEIARANRAGPTISAAISRRLFCQSVESDAPRWYRGQRGARPRGRSSFRKRGRAAITPHCKCGVPQGPRRCKSSRFQSSASEPVNTPA